ncbi:MAG: cobalamin 5'-phosphate synthase [Spirochaetes bacterium RBG_13_51_14]|nr:MAG: cobalamin 5'-phosphate synthase [Spirochaetes bacterium RBG_13_51_14]
MLKDVVRGFILQLRFLTRIPVPIKMDHDDRAFAAGVVFAPVIGLLIGLMMAGAYILFGLLEKRPLAVLVALAAEAALTGGLHLDGLADTFDGLFSYRQRERALAIMRDSRLGASGAIGLFMVLLVKYVMLLLLSDSQIISCLIAMPVLSRMTIAWSAGLLPYARKNEKSMTAALIEHTGTLEIVISTLLAVLISALFLKLAAVPLLMIIIAFTLLMNLYMKFRIGGITGDTIGAVIELSEIFFILSVLILDAVYSRLHMVFIR